jgi:uncharacterized protein YcnI
MNGAPSLTSASGSTTVQTEALMIRTTCLTGMLVLTLSAAAAAHVVVRPNASAPGAEERYAVRVPTEGDVTTTSVRVEIPDGVTVLDVEAEEGVVFETEQVGGRIVGITWKKAIPPKESAEFYFRARNPEGQATLTWKAHQHFADGTVTAWVGPEGDRRPAPMTRIENRAGGR